MDYSYQIIGIALAAFTLGFCLCAILISSDNTDTHEDTTRLDFIQVEGAQVNSIDMGGQIAYGVTTKRPGSMLLGTPAPTVRQAIDSAMLSAGPR